MQDLNDLYYFVKAVEYGGFAPASRALCIPKSKLSRRIAALEERLDTKLIYRSTRSFQLTEVGQTYIQHCKAMLVEAESAQEVIDSLKSEPRGTIRLTCPIALLHAHVGCMLADFMRQYPQVNIQLEASNRRVDLIAEGVDVAIRVRPPPIEDSDLVMRVLSERSLSLVASPGLVASHGQPSHLTDLSAWPSLGLGQPQYSFVWRWHSPNSQMIEVPFKPRFVTTDMLALRNAALAGVGVVQLPTLMVTQQINEGSLIKLLDGWRAPREVIHVVFPSRRGLLPSVRTLIDFLADRYSSFDEQ
ncbi:LysR family transcriptional regulator [Gilvimarinus agarilyticus]|uniref:LysR family transcriptional regulator n=1 Tax=unclassified Gilvimarinus TaxID=2642066 RepID=UPI001C0906A2|nr:MULTISPECIES: LysR family transcriptional regulator [unclassified Gilvimarinus]MBU2887286.1 LysR family transcriptional regulator [Gilvimarinus agarilyticus]MDO6571945.1 LysR family transcriptional regulator [Gilvimarinus sp. 2_MG-2023]MDO6746014.1 LysR family transcriptional regulator [Gilvimarinus sp. 1_MG-2023]